MRRVVIFCLAALFFSSCSAETVEPARGTRSRTDTKQGMTRNLVAHRVADPHAIVDKDGEFVVTGTRFQCAAIAR